MSGRSALVQAPILRALLTQAAAFPLAVLSSAFLESAVPQVYPSWAWVVLQGLFAAGLSRLAGLDAWWMPIQFLLPVLLVAGQSWQLPPWIFLAVFGVLLVLYWSTFRTRVPYFPSRLPTWERVAELLPQGRPLRIVDIGSGFGGLCLHLQRLRPESQCTGIEIAPLPWAVSACRARLAKGEVKFLLGNYFDLDFSRFDIVFAFLSPAAMPDLWQKARAEMQRGSLFISYEFPVPEIRADFQIGPDERGACLYGFRM